MDGSIVLQLPDCGCAYEAIVLRRYMYTAERYMSDAWAHSETKDFSTVKLRRVTQLNLQRRVEPNDERRHILAETKETRRN